MYTILNKQNDYRTNKTKLTLLENKFASLTKLISNQEGNLTQSLLMNIKSKQDLTYNSLLSTLGVLKPIIDTLTVVPISNEGFPTSIEYTTLDSSKLTPYETGNLNFVDMELLTNIMKNELNLTGTAKEVFNQLYSAESNFNSQRLLMRNWATSKGTYLPITYARVNPITINKTKLISMITEERRELEKLFFSSKYKIPSSTESVNEIPEGEELIRVTDPLITVYVKSSTLVEDQWYKDNVYLIHNETGTEFFIGQYDRGRKNIYSSTGETTYTYVIENNFIYIYSNYPIGGGDYKTIIHKKTLVIKPTKLTFSFINSNF